MSQWSFVLAAYGLTLAATLWLLATSYLGARRAERDAEALTRDGRRR